MKQIFILVSSILIFSISAFAGEYTFEYQKIIEVTSDQVNIDLTMFKGKVTVVGSNSDRVIIDAVKTVRASNRDEAEEVADHIEIKVADNSANLVIETNYLKMINRSQSFWTKFLGSSDSEAYGQVDYYIQVPPQTSVKINSMEAIVEVASLEGDVHVKNNSGLVRAEYVYGTVTVSQPVGMIDLNWIEGDIRIKSNSSKIKIKQLMGAIDLATYSGEVHIETELESPKDYYIETTSGAVTFSVPTSAAGALNVRTETGKIKTEFPVTVESVSRKNFIGNFGAGGPTINIVSTTGDVEVNEF